MTKKTRSYRSAAMASIHEAAEGLLKVDAIDETTMREFDRLSLVRARPTEVGLSVGPATGKTKTAGEVSL